MSEMINFFKIIIGSSKIYGLVLCMESLSRFRQTFRKSPSSVEITLERGSNRSTEPIDLKIGLYIEH